MFHLFIEDSIAKILVEYTDVGNGESSEYDIEQDDIPIVVDTLSWEIAEETIHELSYCEYCILEQE